MLDIDPDPNAGEPLDQLMANILPVDRGDWLKAVSAGCSAGTAFSHLAHIQLQSGAIRQALFRAEVLHPGTGDVCLAGHVTWARSQNADGRLEDFINLTDEWFWEMDANLRFTYFSPNASACWGKGASVEALLGKTRANLFSDDNDIIEMDMHLNWIAQHKPFRDFRFWSHMLGDAPRYVSSNGRPLFDEQGQFVGYRGSGCDLTEQQQMREALVQANRQLKTANKAKSDAMASLKEANALLEEQYETLSQVQDEVRQQALHDPLTGVANRRYLDDRLNESAVRCREDDGWLGVLHIDLDRFKQINDTLGHATGDAVLAHVAHVLETHSGPEDFVARVGGDEFVVVRTSHGEQAELGKLAQKLIEALGKPYVHEGRECWFGASIGIAAMQGEEILSDELLMNADIALYRAKNLGRGCFQYFSDEVQQEMLRYKTVADGIRAGLGRDEFRPWYQPQICARTRNLVGFEALARWHPPEGGVRSPIHFLDVAEDLALVPRIDHLILEHALADLATWDDAGLDVPKVSVNVSARRLLDPDLLSHLASLALPRGRIAFELLESAFLDDMESTIVWNIDQLKEMGVEIQLDDFGSGHASIVSLVKIGPETLKIDRQMISAITEDASRLSIVESIINIGKALGVRIIAEGVETEEQARILGELNCESLQGYLFSAPMPAHEVPGFVRQWSSPALRDQA